MSGEGYSFVNERHRMVREQLRARGIQDPRVIAAMESVPRDRFVPEDLRAESYEDRPLPIGFDQTISQPYMVALMTEHLGAETGMKVLEVGTGSGYQAALLAWLGLQVYSIERVPELSEAARGRLQQLGIPNVHLRVGDGSLGWPEEVPFDRILVTACALHPPPALLEQLTEGGRLLIPIGSGLSQQLMAFDRKGGEVRAREICGCLFVPLIERGRAEKEEG